MLNLLAMLFLRNKLNLNLMSSDGSVLAAVQNGAQRIRIVVGHPRSRFGRWVLMSMLSLIVSQPCGIHAEGEAIGIKQGFMGGRVIGFGNSRDPDLMSPPVGLIDAVALAPGWSHALALRANGTVVAWGEIGVGSETPLDLGRVKAVEAGIGTGLVLQSDGSVRGWGNSEIMPPPNLPRATAIAASMGMHTAALAALADGSVVSWGSGPYGEMDVPAGLNDPAAVAAGEFHRLALRTDGTVVAWGYNKWGQATVPKGLKNIVAVAAGSNHSLALRGDGKVFGWGHNIDGQAIPPAGLENIVAIAAGQGFSLALNHEGKLFGWGSIGVDGNGRVTGWSGADISSAVAVYGYVDYGLAIVAPQGTGPIVHYEPRRSYRAETGESLSLAFGAALASSFTWFKDGKETSFKSMRMDLAGAGLEDSGIYVCEASNDHGTVRSSATKIAIRPEGAPEYIIDERTIAVPVENSIVVGDRARIELKTSFPQGSVFFSLDGSAPSFSANAYSAAFDVTETVILRAVAYSSDFSRIVEEEPLVVRVVPTYELDLSSTMGGSLVVSPIQQRYLQDQIVQVEAIAENGYRFVRWEGDLGGAFPETPYVVDRDSAVSAVFEKLPRYRLRRGVQGYVESSAEEVPEPGEIFVEPEQTDYLGGAEVTVTAVANQGWQFERWLGDLTTVSPSETLTMDSDKDVKAVFVTRINSVATGGGTIHLVPEQEFYSYGTRVRVIPVPDAGNYLGTWGSDALQMPKTAFEYHVTKANVTISALFAPLEENQFTVIGVAGVGGAVQSSPAAGAYINGQTVTLTAKADPGYEFQSWTGDMESSDNPIEVVADANKRVEANFLKLDVDVYELTVNVEGSGSVTRSPQAVAYEAGTEVELTAVAEAGFAFVGWEGDASGDSARTRVTMDQARAVTARFAPLYELITEIMGQGRVFVTPPQSKYVAGSEVILTAEPHEGWGLAAWSGDHQDTAQQTTVVLGRSKRVIAEFARLGTLTVQAQGKGTVSHSPEGTEFLPGTTVTLTPEPEAGWEFVGWSGAAEGSAVPLAFQVDRAEAVVAEFRDAQAPAVVLGGPGAGTVVDERFELSGQVSDNEGVVETRWFWNGHDQGALEVLDGQFSVPGQKLAAGENIIAVEADDEAGNVGRQESIVTWTPARTVFVGTGPETREGNQVEVPVLLESAGDVGGLSFVLSYDPTYLRVLGFDWSSAVGASFNDVNFDISGEVRGTFSLGGDEVVGGEALLGNLRVRARSVPEDMGVPIGIEVSDISNGLGEGHDFGTDRRGAELRLLRRRLVADANGNNRLDIGDATLMQRLITGKEEERDWDGGLNDLNQNTHLDAADVTKLLRVLVGLEPAPGIGPRLFSVGPASEGDDVEADWEWTVQNGEALVGEQIQAVLSLRDNVQGVSGVIVEISYDPTQLLLVSKATGALAPGGVSVLWADAPEEGSLRLAVSGAETWPATNGVLLDLSFEVLAEGQKVLSASSSELTVDGFELKQLADSVVMVGAAPVELVFEVEPKSQTVETGAAVTITATALGAPVIAYQWLFNGTSIDGATESMLMLDNVSEADAGAYSVVASAGTATATSAAAILTVNPPMRVVDLDADGNGTTDALSDGVMIVRAMFGFGPDLIVQGAMAPNGTRTVAEIAGYLQELRTELDIDANAQVDALSDGIVLVRYLFGFRDAQLVADAVDPSGARADPLAIADYLSQLQAGLSVPALFAVEPASSAGQVRLFASGGAEQQVTASPSTQTAQPGSEVQVSVDYTTAPLDEALTGLGLRLHYNSSALSWARFETVHVGSKIAQDEAPIEDTNDLDADPTTDKYLQIAWADFTGQWPGVSSFPVRLYDTVFTAVEDFEGATAINFSSSSTAVAYVLAATSAEIVIEPVVVIQPPLIAVHPVSQSVTEGDAVTFSVTASGEGTLGYQWIKDGGDIDGASSSTLDIASAVQGDGGAYAVRVSNEGGSVISDEAILEVSPAVIPVQLVKVSPLETRVVAGAEVRLALYYTTEPLDETVTGLGLRLHFNSSALTWAGFDSVHVGSKLAQDEAPVEDTDDFDGDPSTDKYLQVAWTDFTGQWPGADSLPLRLYDAVFVAAMDFDASTLVNFSVSSTAVGYEFVANSATIVIEAVVTIEPPTIVAEPRSLDVLLGEQVTLAVEATGPGTLAYQWSKDGTAIDEAVAATLVLDAVARGHAGEYTVEVRNEGGKVVSNGANVSLLADLTVTIQGGGSVVLDPTGPTYALDSSVMATAMVEPGFEFVGWNGDASGADNPLTLTMDSHKEVIAQFQALPEQYVLTVTKEGTGSVFIDPNQSEHEAGTSVTLQAVPGAGFGLLEWQGDRIGAENPLTIVMDADMAVHAVFAPAFSIATAALGDGTVELDPEKQNYFAEDKVTVTAVPGPGQEFVRWLGSVDSTEPVLTFTVDSDLDLVAMFEAAAYTVEVTVVGDGSVQRDPDQTEYGFGETLTLTATPNAGSEFVGWSGGAGGSANPFSLSVESDVGIEALFQTIGGSGPWTLTVEINGEGTVELTPDQPEYNDGKLVIAEAAPTAGYSFTGWSGDVFGTSNPLVVRMNGHKTVIATFEDTAPPDITIVLPSGGVTDQEFFEFTGTVIDSSDVTSVQWERDGASQGTLVLDAAAGFSVTGLRLNEGANEFRVVAADEWGNQSEATARVVWQPGQSLIIQNPPEQKEGKRVDVPVVLNSEGNVGGMTFVLRYDPDYLTDPQFNPAAVIGSAFPTVNTSVVGEVRVTFALPGTSLPADAQRLGTISLRARSVPFNLPILLEPEILDIADANGNALSGTFNVVGGEVRILKRRVTGDNNYNDRYDVGDATILLQYAAGLLEQRSWDLTLNDINKNNQVDAGDAGIVLRTVVGLNTQPQSGSIFMSRFFSGAEPARLRQSNSLSVVGAEPQETAVLMLNPTEARPGQIVTLQLELRDVQSELAGASFQLNYPVEALRLTGAQAYQKGAIVPATASVLWNLSPGQNSLETQDGQISFAASSAESWPASNGVVAQFTFEVQSEVTALEAWPLSVTGMDVTSDGYDQRTLADVTVNLRGSTPVIVTEPEFLLSGTHWDGVVFVLSVRGGDGGAFEVEMSDDLETWTRIGTVQGSDGPLEFRDEDAGEGTRRFYRLRQSEP